MKILVSGVKFIVYGKRGNIVPTDTAFDFVCKLPNENPEDSYCGPEALRNASRFNTYKAYLSAFVNQQSSLDYWNFLSNSSSSRCSRAILGAAQPFTCHFTADVIGRYSTNFANRDKEKIIAI